MSCRPLVRRGRAVAAIGLLHFACCGAAAARNYLFENITDLPAGPGSGRSAEINDDGNVAFLSGNDVWYYDRAANSFLDVTALPGAPVDPFFVKLNNNGDIAIIETPTGSRDLWLFQHDTQEFTNVSTLAGYPGDSFASFGLTAFDLNDNGQMSFHSGDNNFGDVYVYDHDAGEFDRITGMPDGPLHGRENEINNAGQVLYMGFPSTYLYDLTLGTTTNINTLPGGPGPALTNLDLNDQGDVALVSATVAQLYDAQTGAFLDIAALPGWPPNILASSRSDLGNSGEVTFWREGLYAFDSNTGRFSKLNGFPGGTEADLNSAGEIALGAGDDIYIATPRPYGDHDNDGDVDGGDFLVWQRGESTDPLSAIDLADWRANFGAAASSTSVPEPGAATLALLTAGWGWCRGRRGSAPGESADGEEQSECARSCRYRASYTSAESGGRWGSRCEPSGVSALPCLPSFPVMP